MKEDRFNPETRPANHSTLLNEDDSWKYVPNQVLDWGTPERRGAGSPLEAFIDFVTQQVLAS